MRRLRESCSTGRTGRRSRPLLREIQGVNTRVLVEVSGGQHNAQPKISVIGRKSGKTISIPVWFVVEGETLYLLPVQGSGAQWYGKGLKNPTIRIDARGVGAEFRATPVTDAKAVKSVIEKSREKYEAEDVKKYYSGFDAAVVVELT